MEVTFASVMPSGGKPPPGAVVGGPQARLRSVARSPAKSPDPSVHSPAGAGFGATAGSDMGLMAAASPSPAAAALLGRTGQGGSNGGKLHALRAKLKEGAKAVGGTVSFRRATKMRHTQQARPPLFSPRDILSKDAMSAKMGGGDFDVDLFNDEMVFGASVKKEDVWRAGSNLKAWSSARVVGHEIDRAHDALRLPAPPMSALQKTSQAHKNEMRLYAKQAAKDDIANVFKKGSIAKSMPVKRLANRIAELRADPEAQAVLEAQVAEWQAERRAKTMNNTNGRDMLKEHVRMFETGEYRPDAVMRRIHERSEALRWRLDATFDAYEDRLAQKVMDTMATLNRGVILRERLRRTQRVVSALPFVAFAARTHVWSRTFNATLIRARMQRQEDRAARTLQKGLRAAVHRKEEGAMRRGKEMLSSFVAAFLFKHRLKKARPLVDGANMIKQFLVDHLHSNLLQIVVKRFLRHVVRCQRTRRAYVKCTESRLLNLHLMWNRLDPATKGSTPLEKIRKVITYRRIGNDRPPPEDPLPDSMTEVTGVSSPLRRDSVRPASRDLAGRGGGGPQSVLSQNTFLTQPTVDGSDVPAGGSFMLNEAGTPRAMTPQGVIGGGSSRGTPRGTPRGRGHRADVLATRSRRDLTPSPTLRTPRGRGGRHDAGSGDPAARGMTPPGPLSQDLRAVRAIPEDSIASTGEPVGFKPDQPAGMEVRRPSVAMDGVRTRRNSRFSRAGKVSRAVSRLSSVSRAEIITADESALGIVRAKPKGAGKPAGIVLKHARFHIKRRDLTRIPLAVKARVIEEILTVARRQFQDEVLPAARAEQERLKKESMALSLGEAKSMLTGSSKAGQAMLERKLLLASKVLGIRPVMQLFQVVTEDKMKAIIRKVRAACQAYDDLTITKNSPAAWADLDPMRVELKFVEDILRPKQRPKLHEAKRRRARLPP